MKRVRKIFWGLFFILAAVLVVVSTMGGLPEISLFTLICTTFLVAMMIESAVHINFTGFLFSLAFLGILYADILKITELTPWPILAVALLGSIGLSIIFGGPRHYHKTSKCAKEYDENKITEEINSTTNDGIVDIRVSMGSSIKYINTDNFREANIDCSFGGVKIYFDKAVIQGEQAELNINASFSGIELYIPKEWKIINNISNVLGGVDEKNKVNFNKIDQDNLKQIIINGTCNLSGIEIIYI